MPTSLNDDQRASFERDGYIFMRGFFDDEETDLLRSAMEQDPAIKDHFYSRGDAEGGSTKMALWNEPGDSVYGMAARSEKMVDTMEDLLEGEVYHYHSKLTAKEPYEGGAWEWHQDYGYWYHNGCLFPYMASAMIALDRSTKDNGCLQVLRGSHLMGRIEHGLLEGEQVGANLERVEEAKKRLDLVYCEMDPGDVLFFHCNTLHRSDQNRSPDRRWTLICCYNSASNNPYKDHHHPHYTKLSKVPDETIKQVGLKLQGQRSDESFLAKATTSEELTKKSDAELART
ncbi:MAG: phytanoyl-CoA dioxygenase family protein [Pseudomonadota bacterium]